MEIVLDVKDLCKTYIVNKRQNNVLRNVNFSLHRGEMTAIMGPSGSGKSTLLYTVSGMDKMSAGRVYLGERNLGELSSGELSKLRLHKMGFVFQQMYMLKNLSVFDNILLPAYSIHKNKKKREEIAEYGLALMRKMDIMEIADQDITEASGGQLQRACICRSLINRPEIIFADEPTGALNRGASREVMDAFHRMNEEGTTILLVTHDVSVAAQCSRVFYIEDGNIKGEYRPDTEKEQSEKESERKLNNWLIEMGW